MDSMHDIKVDGRTIYTDVTANPVTIADWIKSVTTFYESRNTVIVGLDVEWKPNRSSNDNNPAATLQLCAGNRCLIVQLLHIRRPPRSLRKFMKNPRHMFAGVEVARDAAKLKAEYGLECGRLYDVREAALEIWPAKVSRWPGLKELAGTVAGIWIGKSRRVTVSDWEAEVLSEKQIEYACVDAYASCRIGVTLYFNLDWFIEGESSSSDDESY